MLLIPTYVAPSSIEGVGVFAAEDIPAGVLIWELNLDLDRLLDPTQLAMLPPVLKAFAERYGYPYPHDPTRLVLEMDNGRFMNHAFRPNTSFVDPDAGYTIQAVKVGSELTCNYGEFDPFFEMLPGHMFVNA